MANEVQVSCSLSISSGGVTASGSKSLSIDLSGNSFYSGIQSLSGTTREAVTVGPDITLGGYVLIVNRSATATVTIHFDNASADATNTVAALLPGECVLFKPASGATIYATPSADADISVTLTEL